MLDSVLGRGSPIHANGVLSLVVRKLFDFGLQRGELELNPCAGIARPSPDRNRERVLSDEEVGRRWLAVAEGSLKATEPIQLAIRLLLLTAIRVGELIRADWSENNRKARWWEIPAERLKNKHPHRVWLTDRASADLQRPRDLGATLAPGSPWVFPSPPLRDDAPLDPSHRPPSTGPFGGASGPLSSRASRRMTFAARSQPVSGSWAIFRTLPVRRCPTPMGATPTSAAERASVSSQEPGAPLSRVWPT